MIAAYDIPITPDDLVARDRRVVDLRAQQGVLEGGIIPPYESLRIILDALLGLHTSPAIAHLAQMTALEIDWETLGEEPPNKIARDVAARILDIAHSMGIDPNYVTASSAGGVGIVYGPPENYVAIECLNSGDIWSLWYDAKGEPRSLPIACSVKAITEALVGVEHRLNA